MARLGLKASKRLHKPRSDSVGSPGTHQTGPDMSGPLRRRRPILLHFCRPPARLFAARQRHPVPSATLPRLFSDNSVEPCAFVNSRLTGAKGKSHTISMAWPRAPTARGDCMAAPTYCCPAAPYIGANPDEATDAPTFDTGFPACAKLGLTQPRTEHQMVKRICVLNGLTGIAQQVHAESNGSGHDCHVPEHGTAPSPRHHTRDRLSLPR